MTRDKLAGIITLIVWIEFAALGDHQEEDFMPDNYKPPFTMTDDITNLVIEIGELVGRMDAHDNLSVNPRLHRENRIKTIHSSLAIESNTMSLDQVTAVLDGKRVLAPPNEIHEVKNAYEAYEELHNMDPYSVNDLLKAHRIMMDGLIKDAGAFRSGNVGVYSGDTLIHAGSPSNYVPELIKELFLWLKRSPLHPLVKGCIFHYEFEFIHPFSDGNGRTGRLWHSLILQKWKPFFAWLPIETMIYENQSEYYEAINRSNTEGESTCFVEFMLKIIKDTLTEIIHSQDGYKGKEFNEKNTAEEKLLSLFSSNERMTAKEAAAILGLSQRQVERTIAALKKAGRLKRIGANRSGCWKVTGE